MIITRVNRIGPIATLLVLLLLLLVLVLLLCSSGHDISLGKGRRRSGRGRGLRIKPASLAKCLLVRLHHLKALIRDMTASFGRHRLLLHHIGHGDRICTLLVTARGRRLLLLLQAGIRLVQPFVLL